MLMTMKEILDVAYKNKFAVGSYNVSNSELLRAIIETAEEKIHRQLFKSIPMSLIW